MKHQSNQSRFVSTLLLLISWQPFTTRGAILLVLSTISIKWFGVGQKDLVAQILGGSCLAIAIVALLSVAIYRIRLKRRLSVELFFDRDTPTSKTEVPSGIVVSGSSLPPYLYLSLKRCFEHDGPATTEHILKGSESRKNKRHLTDTIMFPHRGLWIVKSLSCTVGDALGLVSLSWELPLDKSVEISPPQISIKPLPIVAASSRAGDQLSYAKERSGDLFDIKAYTPADGIKRILWKTYARSGELVVRRPEPAVIPEGEVAIYLVAEPEDDHVAGATLNYIQQLCDADINVLFGTDGASNSGDSNKLFYTSELNMRQAINRSVWSPQIGTGGDFELYLESLKSDNRQIQKVIVFGALHDGNKRSLKNLSKKSDALWVTRVSKVAAQRSIQLSVALVSDKLDYHAGYLRQTEDNILPKTISDITSSLVEKHLKKRGSVEHQAALTVQINSSGAEVIIVEGQEGAF